MSKTLGDLSHAVLRYLFGNRCSQAAGLALATVSKVKLQIVNAISFSIAGVLYLKAATNEIVVAAAVQAANSTCYYVLCLNSAGTLSAVKGTDGGDIPAVTDETLCPIGVLKIVNAQAASATVTLGTTDLTTAGITTSFKDLAALPLTAADIGL